MGARIFDVSAQSAGDDEKREAHRDSVAVYWWVDASHVIDDALKEREGAGSRSQ